MELFVISSAQYFNGEATWINRLFAAGMSVFHLRKESRDRRKYAALISAIAKPYHDRIALHSFHDLQAEFPGIKRLHYPEQMRKEQGSMPFSQYLIRSTSIHNLDDLEGLGGFAYTFFGPIFDSFSKPGYRAAMEKSFELPQREGTTPVVALGGIDAGKIESLKQMGFEGAAVLGALWNDRAQALDNFSKIRMACKS